MNTDKTTALEYTAIEFTGDWLGLLNGQVTVAPNVDGVRYCAILNTKGRVVVTAWLWGHGAAKAWLILASDMVDEIYQRFTPLAQLSKVNAEIIKQRFYPELSTTIENGFSLPFGSISTEPTDIDSCEWHIKRIKSVYPVITRSFARESFVHYLNLPSLAAVDFDKGCYVGQEIVSRMHFKTTVKKHTYYVIDANNNYDQVVESIENHGLAILSDHCDLELPYKLIE